MPTNPQPHNLKWILKGFQLHLKSIGLSFDELATMLNRDHKKYYNEFFGVNRLKFSTLLETAEKLDLSVQDLISIMQEKGKSAPERIVTVSDKTQFSEPSHVLVHNYTVLAMMDKVESCVSRRYPFISIENAFSYLRTKILSDISRPAMKRGMLNEKSVFNLLYKAKKRD